MALPGESTTTLTEMLYGTSDAADSRKAPVESGSHAFYVTELGPDLQASEDAYTRQETIHYLIACYSIIRVEDII
jgi:hypothetical protein